MIDANITLNSNYVVFDVNSEINKYNLKNIHKLISKLEKANVIIDKKLINGLLTLDEEKYNFFHNGLLNKFKPLNGEFFRSVFASSNDISKEVFTFDDFLKQINHYYISYGLNERDNYIDEDRIAQDKHSKRKNKQELNNNMKIITLKSLGEFKNDIKNIIYLPIVYGEQQFELINEASKHFNINELIDGNIKVKENLFSLMNFKEIDVMKLIKTATDVLRYIYFVNGYDYKTLPLKGEDNTTLKFKLKTSEKTKVMKILNGLADRDMANVYGDMYPKKSHWIAVSKCLYPSSKKYKKYNFARELFDRLRNKDNLKTFNMVTSELIENKDFIGLTKHLSNKSGILIRNLDMIIRKMKKDEIDEICSILENIELNSKLVLQITSWLKFRKENNLCNRTFNVKGKVVQTEKSLYKLKRKRTEKVIGVLESKLKDNLKGKTLW